MPCLPFHENFKHGTGEGPCNRVTQRFTRGNGIAEGPRCKLVSTLEYKINGAAKSEIPDAIFDRGIKLSTSNVFRRTCVAQNNSVELKRNRLKYRG
jgi:hypothetical protein